MYKIKGADGKEYGPASLEQLRQWIGEGAVDDTATAPALARLEVQPPRFLLHEPA